MRNDWMPARRSDQLALATRWCNLLPGKAAAWGISQAMVDRLLLLTGAGQGAQGETARLRRRGHQV